MAGGHPCRSGGGGPRGAAFAPGAGAPILTLAFSAVSARRIALAFLMLDLALMLGYLLPRLLGHGVAMLGLDTEASIPTWYASAK
ncbi:MAG TPA: hypothetical protein VFG43_16900, partial [Geminicoccaceae bacterium]|nr:hypothetical protein [Geminicoccaceae bacterium]